MDRQIPLPVALPPATCSQVERLLADNELTMLGAMYWRVTPSWHMVLRTLPDTFFFFPMAGALVATVESRTRPLVPGQFMMVPAGTAHAGCLPPGQEWTEVVAVHCHIHDRWRRPLLQRFPMPFGELAEWPAWAAQLRWLVTLMNQAPEAGRRYGEVVIKGLLSALVLQGVALLPAPPPADPRIEHALELIRRQYQEGVTVEDLARQCHLSAVQFRKLFRAHLQESPKAFLARYRLQVAARLLRTTDLSVKEIAFRTGFGSDHYFHLAFRRFYGRTPTHYRESGSGIG